MIAHTRAHTQPLFTHQKARAPQLGTCPPLAAPSAVTFPAGSCSLVLHASHTTNETASTPGLCCQAEREWLLLRVAPAAAAVSSTGAAA